MLYKSVLLFAPFLFAVCFACTCMRATQKEAFEQADIVAHVTIISQEAGSDSLEYELHYNESFKPRPPKSPLIIMPIPLPSAVATADNSAVCGVRIEVSKEYLIAGSRQNNTVFVTLCSGIPPTNKSSSATGALPWNLVNNKFLKELRDGFSNKNCS